MLRFTMCPESLHMTPWAICDLLLPTHPTSDVIHSIVFSTQPQFTRASAVLVHLLVVQFPRHLHSHLLQIFAQMSPSQWGLPQPPLYDNLSSSSYPALWPLGILLHLDQLLATNSHSKNTSVYKGKRMLTDFTAEMHTWFVNTPSNEKVKMQCKSAVYR